MSVLGDCVCSFWSVCGAPCLSFLLPFGEGEEGRGWVQSLALTFGLLFPILGHQWSCWFYDTEDALASWGVPCEQLSLPSPGWGGLCCGCTVCLLWVC